MVDEAVSLAEPLDDYRRHRLDFWQGCGECRERDRVEHEQRVAAERARLAAEEQRRASLSPEERAREDAEAVSATKMMLHGLVARDVQ